MYRFFIILLLIIIFYKLFKQEIKDYDYYRLCNIHLKETPYEELIKIYNSDNTNKLTPTMYNTKKNNKYNYGVMAIFKNESMNLKVWIEHYLWQGVDHFYLINNNSTDDYMKILKPYIQQGIVTLYNIPIKYIQVEAYRYVFKQEQLDNNLQWLIIADLDEFWYCPNSKLSIELSNNLDKKYILCNWLMFGTYVRKHPVDIRLQSIHREPNYNQNTKWIIQPKYFTCDNLWIHTMLNTTIEPTFMNDNFKLNHYPLQSLEFYQLVKMTRGDGDNPEADKMRNMEYFDKYNENTNYLDDQLKTMILIDKEHLHKIFKN